MHPELPPAHLLWSIQYRAARSLEGKVPPEIVKLRIRADLLHLENLEDYDQLDKIDRAQVDAHVEAVFESVVKATE